MSGNTDDKLLSGLFEEYKQMMFKIAMGILHNISDAEDAVQDAFVHIINNLKRFSRIPAGKRKAYLNKVVKNICYDRIRKEKRRHECNIDDFDLCSGSVDDEVFLALTVEEIRNLLNELPERDQEILYFYLFDDYPPKDIAKIMGIPQEQISTYIERARKQLIKLLKERGITNDI